MTTTFDVSRPVQGSPVPVAPPSRRRRAALAWKIFQTALVLSVVAFNGWWYWRNHRPLPDMATISTWLQRERFADVEWALREHLRRSPNDGDARMMLARSLAGRKDFVGCARTLHQVPWWWPGKQEALLREGQAYLQIDRAKDAETAWLEALKDDPLHPATTSLYHDVCQELLKLYAVQDRWEDAFPVMWRAYEHANPVDYPVLLAMRLRAELERIAPKESIAVLRKYAAADPKDWEAREAVARAEMLLGRHSEAARAFQDCIAGRPDNVRAWRDYLTMLLDNGELDTFLTVLNQPPPSADTEPETWLFRAVAHEKAGDRESARAEYERAIRLNPFVPKYHYRLAMLQERMGLREEAKVHRQRNKEMNEARVELRQAYADFFAVQAQHGLGSLKMAAICRRLATICETLGWARAAHGWNQLARQARIPGDQ
jgi:tetratricopeptide (TPR) repeat protein